MILKYDHLSYVKKSIVASDIALLVNQNWICCYLCPQIATFDNGSEFSLNSWSSYVAMALQLNLRLSKIHRHDCKSSIHVIKNEVDKANVSCTKVVIAKMRIPNG